MPRSFQKPEDAQTWFANRDSHEGDGIKITMSPDGSLVLEPGGWPDGEMDKLFDGPVLLKPAQVLALHRFFDGSRVRNRLGDINHARLLENPNTRELIQWFDAQLDAEQACA